MTTPVGEGVELRWRPFQLYPNIDTAGVDRGEHLRQRYGASADIALIPERIRAEAESEGITLRFDLIKRTPNTLLAHRLLEHAYDTYGFDLQNALSERLFRAYFCEGKDAGDQQVLLQLAADVGMNEISATTYLNSGAGTDEVESQLARAPDLGVGGVPAYILAGSFLLPGAQSVDTISQIITRAKIRLA